MTDQLFSSACWVADISIKYYLIESVGGDNELLDAAFGQWHAHRLVITYYKLSHKIHF